MVTTTAAPARDGPGHLVPAVAAVGRPAAEAGAVSADLSVAAELVAAEALARAGNSMRTKEFLSKLEHDRIVQAIREAESKTSGQIRVYIQRGKLNLDPLIAAQKKFHRM